MVDTVPRRGSPSFARVRASERVIRHGGRPASAVERGGFGKEEPLARQTPHQDQTRPASTIEGVRSRTANRSDDPTTRIAGSSHPGMSNRRSPSSTVNRYPSRRSSQTAPGRTVSTVSSLIASSACPWTNTPRSSCARVDRNRWIRASVTASASMSFSDGAECGEPLAQQVGEPGPVGCPSDRDRFLVCGIVRRGTPDVGEDVAPPDDVHADREVT